MFGSIMALKLSSGISCNLHGAVDFLPRCHAADLIRGLISVYISSVFIPERLHGGLIGYMRAT